MVSVYRKIMTMQIKNGLCLLCIFALMLLLAACFSLHTPQAEVKSFSVILLLVIGLLLMSVLALIAFLRYKMLRNKQQHQEEMNRNYSAPPMGMSNHLTVVLQQELH